MIDIRPTAPDQPQVQGLLRELDAYLATLYAPEDNHILDLQGLLHPSVVFMAAWEGDRAVGCGAVRLMPGEEATAFEPYGEIKRMMVEPARRGQRIGARLLECLQEGLRERGPRLCLLETGRDQHEALALYRRCGYLPRAAFGGYPDNGLSVFMEKRWTPA